MSCCSNLKMSEKIDELEKAALAAKPWQLSGEVTAQTRPENSMLEEDVEFEQASRMGECLLFCVLFLYLDVLPLFSPGLCCLIKNTKMMI